MVEGLHQDVNQCAQDLIRGSDDCRIGLDTALRNSHIDDRLRIERPGADMFGGVIQLLKI